ncbi:hypothetical protein TSOC_000398 [Tetrabaena socialis]|uniref:Uncharacterized protein n=1 Tax=Tetrabaena socialis TaxID=47790 RepID=A0A2J8AJH1_9CHLO|nr:hypothetical protein TSOC_000398 [Tetrabaena socialis]|eukprot:PNH12653.1 hypothetical protein TSOC_000398 [Tetrabaena socialis]
MLYLVLGILLSGRCWAQLPDGCAWLPTSRLEWSLSGCGAPLALPGDGGLATRIGREPALWLPAGLRPVQEYQAIALVDLTLALPSCEALWELAASECTLLVSATWPSPGLQAGPAYLYYRLLVGARSTAQRVNITCPPEDWMGLLAARGGAGSSGGVPLAPCGTATVTTGLALVEALQQLQPGHARVLVTLDAHMALPAQPTPQRNEVAPDDATPLVRVYRNVTLAGGLILTSSGPTAQASTSAAGAVAQLDLRLHRNIFGLAAGDGVDQPVPSSRLASNSSSNRPVLVFADLQVSNEPRGPPSSWPLALLGIFQYSLGMDRYSSYWFRQLFSPVPEESGAAVWLQQLGGVQQLLDNDGRSTSLGHVGDYSLAYNSTVPAGEPLEPIAQLEFDMWTGLPPRLPNGTQPPPLPPGSVAVASSAAQLLALLQEMWNGGPRAILLPVSITLQPGEWPQDGAALSYNVTLVGPATGAPVWLFASGLQLVRSIGASAAAAGASVQLQLLRLRLLYGCTLESLRTFGASMASVSVRPSVSVRDTDSDDDRPSSSASADQRQRQLQW